MCNRLLGIGQKLKNVYLGIVSTRHTQQQTSDTRYGEKSRRKNKNTKSMGKYLSFNYIIDSWVDLLCVHEVDDDDED